MKIIDKCHQQQRWFKPRAFSVSKSTRPKRSQRYRLFIKGLPTRPDPTSTIPQGPTKNDGSIINGCEKNQSKTIKIYGLWHCFPNIHEDFRWIYGHSKVLNSVLNPESPLPIIFSAFAILLYNQTFCHKTSRSYVFINNLAFPSLSLSLRLESEQAETKQPKLQETLDLRAVRVFASVCGIFAGVLLVVLVELLCQPIAIRIPKLRLKHHISWTFHENMSFLANKTTKQFLLFEGRKLISRDVQFNEDCPHTLSGGSKAWKYECHLESSCHMGAER